MDPGRGARRLTGAVVLPPVRVRATGPQLAQPRGGGGVRQRPALLDGPGRRRVPDRRLRRPDEGRHVPGHGHRGADHPQGGRQPRPRGLPEVPPGDGRVPRRPDGRDRDGRRGRHRGAVHPTRRDAPGVQLPLRARGFRRSRAARCHRLVHRRERRGGGADDLGDRQPRHPALGVPPGPERGAHRRLRAGHDGLRGLPGGRPRARHPTGSGTRAHPARPARARPTSTTARSWACPTSTTCPTRSCRTRSGSAAGTQFAAATAAGCRCRGRPARTSGSPSRG